MARDDELSAGALNIVTAVKYDVDLINAVNRMTFLFDPNWQGIGNTLPLAFFYVKDFKEVMETEISQKTLLFYNSQNGSNPDAVSGGLLGVVSDNIINKPKKYQMSIIIPRNIDIYMRQYVFSNRVSFADIFKSKDETLNGILAGVDIVTQSCVALMSVLIQILGSSAITLKDSWGALDVNLLDNKYFTVNVNQWISERLASGVEDSNKASIEAMWENRTILRMKCWNGWKFKYVAIENFTPSKSGTEDDFYEATLNVTEIPIMSLRKGSNIKTPKAHILASKLLSGKLKLNTKVISEYLDKLEDKGTI